MNFMAQDNPTIQFAAKEACRGMAKPTGMDFLKVKKLVRFIVGVVKVEWKYCWQEECETGMLRVITL